MSAGGTLGVQTRRYGGLEAGCKYCDVEVRSSEAPEARRRREGVKVSRYRGIERRRHAVGVQIRRYGDLEARCRYCDV